MERYWVSHPQEVFVPCTCEADGDQVRFLELDTGRAVPTAANQPLASLPKVHEAQLQGAGNVCELVVVDNAAVLHTVRTRYRRSDIYTFVSKMLIAVNPFKELDVYSKEKLQEYLGAQSVMDLPPHIYALGRHADQGLQQNRRSQVVLISGESGAGKTESAKLVMSYISEALGSSRHSWRRASTRYSISAEKNMTERRKSRYLVTEMEQGKASIQDKIIQTNPILEAFGNAMTVRNNNSSRFGKWTQMMISGKHTIEGCSVTDYLLEVTRVCSRGDKERNYHIFFQLLQARSEEDLKDLAIRAPKDYSYIAGSQVQAPGIDDARCFLELKEAFRALDFEPEVQKDIFQVVVAILELGNLEFQGEEAELKSSPDVVAKAAQMLAIAPDALSSMLLRQRRKVGPEVVESKRSTAQAKATRDTFARMLYGRTFKWLIEKLNSRLLQNATSEVFFGVLDIAGFESFEHNSLEQLFINLSNEILQKHFNEHFFTMELQEYEAEGISVGVDVKYQDNTDIVSLINAKGGILSILDDEALIPKTTDQTFASKVTKAHGSHPRMVKSKMGGDVKFGIKHFAGEVTYGVAGFLEKNVAKLPEEAATLLASSSSPVLQEIGKKVMEEAESEKNSRGRKAKTVSSGFRQSLEDLMKTVESAEPHFIRCLKPNAAKAPDNFESKYTYEQMLYSGIFEAVRIRQSGFPMRLPHAEFLERYKRLLPVDQWHLLVGKDQVPFEEKLQLVLVACKASEEEKSGLVLGKSKVFGRATTMNHLEELRHQALELEKQQQQAAREELAAAIKGRDLQALKAAMVRGEVLNLEGQLMKEAEAALELEEKRAQVVKDLEEAIELCEVPRLRACIKRAEEFQLTHPEDTALVQKAITTMQRELWPQARQGLAAALRSREVGQLREALREAELINMAPEEMQPARQALEEEEHKAAARELLAEAKQGSPDAAKLQQAIAQAEKAGLSEAEVTEAREILALELRRAAARAALQSATKSRKVQALQAALQEAEDCHLNSPEIYEAKRTLADEQSKGQARHGLEQAVRSRDLTELRAALRQAQASGLEETELQRARMVEKQEEIKLEALRALEQAIKSRDIEELKAALHQGQSSLDVAQMKAAKKVLEEEQTKVAAQAVLERATQRREITALKKAIADGLAAGAFEAVAGKEKLTEAVQQLSFETMETLRCAIEEAEASEVHPMLITSAKTKLDVLERQRRALAALQDALDFGHPDVELLAQAIAEAESAGLQREEDLVRARKVHAEEKRRAKARQTLFSAVQSRQVEELLKALEEAKACGIEEDLLEEGQDILATEERKTAALQGLASACWSRGIRELQSALRVAEDAGVPEAEMFEARQVLGVEERKEEAKSALEEAARSRDVEKLLEALEEAEGCGLAPKELEAARRVLAEERRKAAALEVLEAAIRGCEEKELEAAICQAEQANLDATELDTAKSLLENERQKTLARQGLKEALQLQRPQLLREALQRGAQLGLGLEELAPAQEALRAEERREAAREALREAAEAAVPNLQRLSEALEEAAGCGLPEQELAPAKERLVAAQQIATARAALASAVRSQSPAELAAALQLGSACGLSSEELAPVQGALAEARLRSARQSLQKAKADKDVGALFRAVAEAEAAGLDPLELEEAKESLDAVAGAATEEAQLRLGRGFLLAPHPELSFEVARQALHAEGYGGFDWKVRESVAFSTVAVGQELQSALERAWFGKKASILEELCENLRSCQVSATGKMFKADQLDKKVLFKLGYDLKCQKSFDAPWASFPIALASMLLYTQQDVDTDRTMLFPDCPSSAVGPRLFAERKEAYDSYRRRVAPRNSMVSQEVSRVATSALHAALRAGLRQAPDPAAEQPLQKWVKTACLLSSCRQTLEEPKVLTRMLMNLSDRGVQELKKKHKEDLMVCPQVLSTSAEPSCVEKYLSLGAANLEHHAILTIRNVTECLDLSGLSQYPEEREVLLPFLSVLKVQEVSFKSGEPIRVICSFHGSMLSPRLKAACLSDLAMASYELVQALDFEASPGTTLEVAKLPSPKSGESEVGQYNSKTFQSLLQVFEAIDRRGAWMISHADYIWAQDTLARSFGAKRVLRKLAGFFAKSQADLTLQRYFMLTMPGATDAQLDRAFRWAGRQLRAAERSRRTAESALPGAAIASPMFSPESPADGTATGSPVFAWR
ncbi:unnamed protein product [Effrenium voratum]|nr:unnamed protein product [Effrenium voratum]